MQNINRSIRYLYGNNQQLQKDNKSTAGKYSSREKNIDNAPIQRPASHPNNLNQHASQLVSTSMLSTLSDGYSSHSSSSSRASSASSQEPYRRPPRGIDAVIANDMRIAQMCRPNQEIDPEFRDILASLYELTGDLKYCLIRKALPIQKIDDPETKETLRILLCKLKGRHQPEDKEYIKREAERIQKEVKRKFDQERSAGGVSAR